MFKRLCLALLLLMSFSASIYAIGEVTPTPDDNPAPTVPPPPTATPVPTQPPAPQENTPENAELEEQLEEATTLLTTGDLEGALELLDAVISEYPDTDEALALRGITRFQLGRYQQSIDDFTRAIEIVPYEWTYYLLRGDAYVETDDVGGALLDYEECIYRNPRFGACFASRSNLNESLGEGVASRADEAIARGLQLYRFGDLTSAIQAYTDAVDTGIEDPKTLAAAYYNRAIAYSLLDDPLTAEEDYTRAIESDAQMHDAYLGRGIARRVNGDLRGAGDDFYRRMNLLETNPVDDNMAVGETRDVMMAYGNVYRFTFSVEAGQMISITARDTGNTPTDPLIALLNPDGTPIAGDDDFGGNLDSQIQNLSLRTPGTYTLVVSHANGGFDGFVRVTIE